jgi:hypothetical protein
MCLLAGLWHMLIMDGFYMEHSSAIALAEPRMQFIILGYLILGLLMAYIYPKGYGGGGSVSEGLRFGAILGLLWVLPHGVVLHGVEFGAAGLLILVDAVWHMVEEGAGGIVMALIYGSSARDQNAESESTA